MANPNKTAQVQIFTLTMQACGEKILSTIIQAKDQINSIEKCKSAKALASKHFQIILSSFNLLYIHLLLISISRISGHLNPVTFAVF